VLDSLLTQAVQLGASDIHLTVGLEPTARVHGDLVKLSKDVLIPDEAFKYVRHILGDADFKKFENKGEVDCSYFVPGVSRFRLNIFRQRKTCALCFRVIASKIPPLEDLNLPSIVSDLAYKNRGIILVTGPTGSGKSTTLAAMIDYMNRNTSRHILTIEDPIEYLHKHFRSMVNQREVGVDTMSFANALRGALREDPDVILVGEMRDPETIAVALTAAETGHLVLSTLHTIGAAKTIDRITDAFPPDQQQQIKVQLSSVIEAVISQQMLPRCDVKGRIPAFEIMVASPAIRNLIREGKTHQIQTVIQTSAGEKMCTMDSSLISLMNRGAIDRETLLKYAVDVEYVAGQIGRAASSF
jgi:twitching motility protein PilT